MSHLDVTTGIKTVQLVDYLKHCALHLIVTTSTIVKTGTTCKSAAVRQSQVRLRITHSRIYYMSMLH